MNETLTLKRTFSIAVAAATILWSVGFAALVAPATASAVSAGDLVRGETLSAVYYYAADGQRYSFPNEKTYFSWYSDFSDVMTISDSELAEIPLASNIVYRPGSRWIKITSDPKVYAVTPDGEVRWVESEDVAVGLAGADWNTFVDDVADVFFVDYTVGASLMSADMGYNGALVADGSDTYLIWGGEKRMVTSDGMSANGLQSRFVLSGAGVDLSGITAGADLSSASAILMDSSQMTTSDDSSSPTVGTGAVSVSAASSMPAGATLPQGANAVTVFSVDLRAGTEASTVTGATFDLVGVGATTNVSNVYVYEGSTRLTDARSVNASTRELTFNNLNLDFAANQTRTLSLQIEVATGLTAGDNIQFGLDGANVNGPASVSGSATGNAFAIANASTGNVDIDANGSITNPNLGADDAVIGQFRIAANSEAASLEMMTLKVDNAADHTDYRLWDGNVELVSGSFIGNKLVKFDLSSAPFAISEGGSNIFKVTADIGGDSTDTVKVYVDNKVDVVAIGGDYGYGLAVNIATTDSPAGSYDGTSCTSSAGNCSYSTVAGGDITFSFQGPSAGDLPRDSQDQTLLKFNLTAENDVTVKDLDIIVYADDDGDNDATDATDDSAGASTSDDDGLVNTNAEGNITDIKIVNLETGVVVMGPLELDSVVAAGDDADQTIDFTDDFTLNGGETLQLAVTADIDNDIASGTEVAAALDVSGFQAEDSNGDTICTSGCTSSNIVPSADLTGYNHEALSASLTFQLASSASSSTVVQGTAGVNFLSASVTAGDASDVLVTNLTLTGYGDDTDGSAMTAGGAATFQIEDFITQCALYDGSGTLLDGPKGIETNGDILFNTIVWTVPAGSTELVVAKCDLANPSDTDNDFFALDIDTSSDVTAEDSEGTTVTASLTASGSGDDGINDTNASASVFDASVVMTVDDAGTLTSSVSSGTPSADFVVTGSSDNKVGEFTFTSANENFIVTKLSITEEAAQDNGQGTDATTYANNIGTVTIEYPAADGTTKTASASMAGNEAKFSSLDFLVEEGQNNNLVVYVSVPASDRNSGGAATSNEKIEVGISEGTGDFEAVGQGSGTTLTSTSGGALETDKTFIVRETKPTVSLASGSPSGAKIPGDQEVLRFNVAANSNEDVVLNEIIFDISSTDNGSTGWNLCDADDSVSLLPADLDFYNLSDEGTSTALDVDASWASYASDEDTCATAGAGEKVEYVHLTLATAEVVPAGSTYTYALYLDSTGATSGSSGDTLQVSIASDLIENTTWLATSILTNDASTCLATATTCTVDTYTTEFGVGDLVCFDADGGGVADCDSTEEIALVTAIPSSTTLSFVRGYMGRNIAAIADNTSMIRLPGAFLWQDDGSTSVSSSTQEYYGAYLVDNLPVTGNSIAF